MHSLHAAVAEIVCDHLPADYSVGWFHGYDAVYLIECG
jgi:hypothetical protein